mgnify:FL=1
MGIGNYYLNGARSVYIDLEQVFGEDYVYCDHEDYVNLLWHIKQSLPKTYSETHAIWLDDNSKLIAQSGMFRVSIVQWGGYFAVNVEVIPDQKASSLAEFRLDQEADRIFDHLGGFYNLRVRSCAWTSSERTPLRAVA